MLNDIFKQNMFSAKMNLVVSDGADRGKVNIDADYLSVEGLGLNAVDLTADLAVSGANGLDTGSEAADTWYSVWVIASTNASIVASLLSTSATAPTLPVGYSFKRRVGWVRNNAASDLFRFYHNDDWWVWNEVLDASPFRLVNNGQATTFTAVTAFAPSTCRLIACSCSIRRAAAGDQYIRIRPTGSNRADDDSATILRDGNITLIESGWFPIALNSSQQFDYRILNGTLGGDNTSIWEHQYLDVV